MRKLSSVVALAILCVVTVASPAAAAVPAGNIIFQRFFEDRTTLHVSRDGAVQPFFDQPLGGDNDTNPEWSPDGSHVAFASTRDGALSIYIANADATQVRRLTVPPVSDDPSRTIYDDHPTWSPDGKTIAFQSNREDGTGFGYDNIWTVPTDASAEPKLLMSPTADIVDERFPAWSPDGSWIAFTGSSMPQRCYVDPPPEECVEYQFGVRNEELWVVAADDSAHHLFAKEESEESHPAWSPDGTQIAYLSRVGPYPDIFVRDVTSEQERQLTSTPDVSEGAPTWSPDGARVAFPFPNADQRNAPNIYSVPAASAMTGVDAFTNHTGGAGPDGYGYWPDDSAPDWGSASAAVAEVEAIDIASEPVRPDEAVGAPQETEEPQWGLKEAGIIVGGMLALLVGAGLWIHERKKQNL